MSQRVCGLRGVMVMSVAFVVLVAVPTLAQDSAPRTAWGEPDLQGVWDFRTATPLQRPASQADKAFLTEEEAAAFEAQGAARRARLLEPSEVRTEPLAAGGGGRAR